MSREEISAKVTRALKLVNLSGLEKRYPGQLSGGQQQRVALARALVLNPDVLLLDEPLSNLDAKIRVQVRAEIRKLQKDLGITTIYVTHDQEEALTLSDRIAVLDHGKMQQVGCPRDLYAHPQNPFVADFIGVNNLIPGEVKEPPAAGGRMKVQSEFGALACTTGNAFKAGERCVISVRPETAAVVSKEEAAEGYNQLTGTVSFSSYIGNMIRYDVEIKKGFIFKVDIQNPWFHQAFPIGQKVWVRFPAEITLGIPLAPERG
jgi:ABC-type Fe3+/spermidine/putrescine transport system ATPase subunit